MWCDDRVLKELSTDVYSITGAKDAYRADNMEISSDFPHQNIRGESKILLAPSKRGMFNIIILL